MVLADGQYKLVWTVGATPREKIFRVNCRDENNLGAGAQGPHRPIVDPGTGNGVQHGVAAAAPQGAVQAGAGGLAPRAAAFSPLTGAAAVGLAVVGGAAYFRLVRRRPHRVA
jgi:lysozyme family protein